ncbi:MAG: outer membrane beta-barrel protein [Fermentimonas sp.]|nr:outer membrane beta-barrel protein [Fermentimonas sp.]
MNDQWQDKLRNRFNSHEEPAPEGLWEVLENRIVSENIVSGNNIILPVRKNQWLCKISIGVVSAAAAVILLFLILNISEEKQTSSQFTDNSVQEEVTKEIPTSKIIIADNESNTTKSQALYSEKSKLQENVVVVKTTTVGRNIEENNIEENAIIWSDNTEIIDNNNDVVDTKEKVSKEEDADNLSLYKRDDQLFASNEISSRNRSRWQTNVSMSNTPSGSSETYSGYGTFALEETVNEEYAFTSQYTREEAYTDVKHKQPITFGLTFRYNLTDRWSLSSGLTYSLLSSKLRSESSNYFYDDTQTLHYLGIPLKVGYTFWQNNKISTYISAGGLVEKNIAGKLTSNYFIDNELESTTSKSFTSSELQWSVNSAIGIEYRISNFIGIYAEPGIVYYFNNGSKLESIYKDQPTNFNLRIGLRFNINDK